MHKRYTLPILLAVHATSSLADSQNTTLPTVTVTAVRPLSPGKTSITPDEIDSQQAISVPHLLDNLPGVDLNGNSRPGGQSLNIWGFGDTEDVRVQLDGANKGFEKYRQGSLFIEPELIKQINVDKGAHSVRYGNGGFGGTIRVESKDARDLLRPGEHVGGLLKFGRYNNDGQHVGSATVFARGQAALPVELLASLTRRDGNNQRRADGTAYPFSATNSESTLLKLALPLGESRLTLSMIDSNSAEWSPFAAKRDDIPAPTQADINRYGLEEAWRRKVLWREQRDETRVAQWQYAPAELPWLALNLRYSRSASRQDDRRPDSVSSDFAASLGHQSHTAYRDEQFELSNTAQLGSDTLPQQLAVGVQSHRQRRDTLMYLRNRSTDASYNYGWMQPYYMPSGFQDTLGGYAEYQLQYGPLSVTPGLRYDKVDNEGVPNLAPRYNDPQAGHDYRAVSYSGWSKHLALSLQALRNLSLFADAGHTWRTPVIDEQYEVQSAASSAPKSSRGLRKERLTALRGGLKLEEQGLFSRDDSLVGTVTAYRNIVHDNIHKRFGVMYEPGAANPGKQSFYRNLPGYRTEGLELELHYDSRSLFASAALSWMRGQHTGSVRNPWGQNQPVSDVSPRKAVLTVGGKLPALGLAIGWQGKFVRKQDREPNDQVASYALPTSLGYSVHSVFARWQGQGALKDNFADLSIDNVFNRSYQPYMSEAVYAPGRNLKLSVGHRF